MTQLASPKVSFKALMLQAREDAIINVVNQLLSEKGFEAMTVDEVAARVGIAKASLYKHFPSKEDLAAAAMVGVMQRAQEYLQGVAPGLSALVQLLSARRYCHLCRAAYSQLAGPPAGTAPTRTWQRHLPATACQLEPAARGHK